MRRQFCFSVLFVATLVSLSLSSQEASAAGAIACGFDSGNLWCAAALRFPNPEEAQEQAVAYCASRGISSCHWELLLYSKCHSSVLTPSGHVWSVGDTADSAADLAIDTCWHGTSTSPCKVAFTVCETSANPADIRYSPALVGPDEVEVAPNAAGVPTSTHPLTAQTAPPAYQNSTASDYDALARGTFVINEIDRDLWIAANRDKLRPVAACRDQSRPVATRRDTRRARGRRRRQAATSRDSPRRAPGR